MVPSRWSSAQPALPRPRMTRSEPPIPRIDNALRGRGAATRPDCAMRRPGRCVLPTRSPLWCREPQNLNSLVLADSGQPSLKPVASVSLAGVVVEDADVGKRWLDSSPCGFLQEKAEFVHVLSHLTVVKAAARSRPDLQLTDDCEFGQGLPSPSCPPVKSRLGERSAGGSRPAHAGRRHPT